ncbi:MAG: S41 family peptidase [Chitinophagaceae bacterium]
MSSTFCIGQTNLSKQQVKSLTTLGEIWGFLKYYHPAAAKGKWDWDSVLIAKIPFYLKAKDKKSVSKLTKEWILELGQVNLCSNCYQHVPDSIAYNLDFSWINKNTFEAAVIDKLNYIKANRNTGNSYYVEYDKTRRRLVNFIHEKIYNEPAFLYPDAAYRLLLLFRYWNIVNYFSPYKYLNGQVWNKLLESKIPAFYTAKDKLTYQLEYVRLINSLNDGHSTVYSAVLDDFLGKRYTVPFLCMRLKDQFVVSSILNDSAAASLNIKKGDIIKEVNGKKAIKLYHMIKPYVIASNDDSRAMTFAASFLFRAKDSIFIIKKIRGEKEITETIQLSQFNNKAISADKAWQVLPDSIGYVDMGVLPKIEVDKMMNALRHTKAIVFDIRNYPHDTWPLIANYLSAHPFAMAKIAYPDLDYPGVFLFANPLYGKENKNPYTGKVILLVDESSVSHAEYSAMGLQAAAQTITIGNTTAGKDGDVTYPIWLPGGLFTRFSGLGIYYPNGVVTQRRGIKIDIKVRPTSKGLQEGRDEVIEAALDYINTKD